MKAKLAYRIKFDVRECVLTSFEVYLLNGVTASLLVLTVHCMAKKEKLLLNNI